MLQGEWIIRNQNTELYETQAEARFAANGIMALTDRTMKMFFRIWGHNQQWFDDTQPVYICKN